MKYLLPLLFIIASCNQNPQNPLPPMPFNGSISYTINDTLNVSYSTGSNYFVKHKLDCGLSGISVSDTSVLGRQVQFTVTTDNFFNGGLYSDTLSVPCNKPEVYFYISEKEKVYSNKFWLQGFAGKQAADTYIKITSLTDSTITGTFAARMLCTTLDYADTLKFTNGQFNMNFMVGQ